MAKKQQINYVVDLSQYKKFNGPAALQSLLDSGVKKLHAQLRPEFEGNRWFGRSLRIESFDEEGVRLAADTNVVLDYDDIVIPQAVSPNMGRADVYVKAVDNAAVLLKNPPKTDGWVKPHSIYFDKGVAVVVLDERGDTAYPASAFLWSFVPRVFDMEHYKRISQLGGDAAFSDTVEFVAPFGEEQCIAKVSIPYLNHEKFYIYNVTTGTFVGTGKDSADELLKGGE